MVPGTQRWGERLFGNAHADVVVTFLESEIACHTAASVGLLDLGRPESAQNRLLHGGPERRVLVAVGLHDDVRGQRHGWFPPVVE